MVKTVCLIAGEKSGDLIGSKIINKIKRSHSDVNFIGVGGELMKKEGIKTLFPMEELSIMGITEVLPKIYGLMKRIKETAEFILKNKPDIVITVDSPDFNFRVMKIVKKFDSNNLIKKVHFIAPSVWAYRKNRAKKIAKIYDLLFCILPFEPPYFEKYGLKSVFVGHPIFDGITYKNSLYNFNSNIISITLGSRMSEVKKHLPIIKNVIKNLPNNDFFILATDNTANYIRRNITNVKIISEVRKKSEIIRKSKLVIAKSGTNNLEIASLGVPMVVYYKFGFITNLLLSLIRKKADRNFANLINIINNKRIIPEVLLFDCTSDNIITEVNHLLNNKKLCLNQIKQNIDTVKILGYNSNASLIDKIFEEINGMLYEQ